MFRRVKKRYPGPQEEKMTVRPGFFAKKRVWQRKKSALDPFCIEKAPF